MSLRETNKKFNFAYEKLYHISKFIAIMMERDLEEFSNYGIYQKDIDEFRQLCEEFIKIEPDAVLLGTQMFKTEDKNQYVEEIRKMLYRIMLSVRNIAKQEKVVYVQFRNEIISKLTDNELVSQARVTIKIISKRIELFEDQGINQYFLDNFIGKINALEAAYLEQQIAISERDIATQIRINKANNVFELLNKYSYIGKNMWAIVGDEARGNDYIINK